MDLVRPRGTEDVFPEAAARWRALEGVCRSLARRYGYGELRTPTFEHSEVFHRHLGDATDVVQKETYDFKDRGGRQLTLRPEGTAGAVRAFLQAGLQGGPLPCKLFYVTLSAFRYERPQAGRLREHHQFGCEVLGSGDPSTDAELIALVADLLRELGVQGFGVRLNSIGDPACRPAYLEALRTYYRPLLPELCPDCQARFQHNPLRLLDCKRDREAVAGAPRAADHLCAACAAHFALLRGHLDALGIDYAVDHTLVRGFDYYTRTVFEFVSGELGAQNSILGGGRYDGLVASMGGPALPAAGFAVGMERLLAVAGGLPADAPPLDAYVAAEEPREALLACQALRRAGLAADMDPLGRSLRAQLRAADRRGATWAVIRQAPERARDVALLRPLRDPDAPQREVAWSAFLADPGRLLRHGAAG
jgi:histidyl-tRNA synthetase